jgi:parvulin-like peptidyl-prolyl isomerase
VNKYVVILAASLLMTACSDDASLATVGGWKLSQSEFDNYLALRNVPKEDKARANALLDELLKREALAQAIVKSDAKAAGAIELEVEEFRRQALISRYFEKTLDAEVNDAAIESYYKNNQSKYEERRAKLAHILVRTLPSMTEPERQAAQTKAREAYSKLQAGASFAEIAKAYSDDVVSRDKAGELGWVREGAIDPAFSEKAFALKAGEMSEPFSTTYGFHIVKVIEPATVARKPFEAVKGDIRYQLRGEAKEREIKRLEDSVTVKKHAS